MQWFVDWFNDMTIGMDWHQFIPSLVATFVGIFVPFWIQGRHEKRQRRKDAIYKIKLIIKELKNALMQIQTREEKANQEGAVYIDPLQTPIGDELLNTSERVLLDELQKYLRNKYKRQSKQAGYEFVTANWYKMIFEVYANIATYNKLWEKYAEQVFFIRNNFLIKEDESEAKKEKEGNASQQPAMDERERVLYKQASEILKVIGCSRAALASRFASNKDIVGIVTLTNILNQVVEALDKKRGE